MLTVLALAPIVLLIVDLIVFRRNVAISALIVTFLTIIIALAFWRVEPIVVPASLIKGGLVSFDIVLIIFGALYFLNMLRSLDIISAIERYLGQVSSDCRVQLIMLAWLFGSLVEGSAGFGTPAVIIVPLLVFLGFPAVFSVGAALLANSVNAAFGAVGTPIRIGFAGLDISGITVAGGALGGVVCIFVPLMLLGMLTRHLKRGTDFFLGGAPFALAAGIGMGVFYFAGSFVGMEFPSLIGPLAGIGIVLLLSRWHLLLPSDVVELKERTMEPPAMSPVQTLLPYALLLAGLVAARYTLPSFDIALPGGLDHAFHLFNPGLVLLAVTGLLVPIYQVSKSKVLSAISRSIGSIFWPALTIFLIVTMMQLMINSGQNSADLESMLFYAFANIRTEALPVMSPLLGAFGSFVAGSVTVSNMIFGAAQVSAAEAVGYPVMAILAMQLIGATAGNMISIPNIMAAQAAGDIEGKESDILRAILPWLGAYLVLITVLGLLALHFSV